MMPILFAILDEKNGLIDLREKVGTYDRKYCRSIKGNIFIQHLAEKPWDTYRDLEKIFKHVFCKKHNFDLKNTLLIDSDNRKI